MSGFSAAGRESDDGGVLRPYFFDCLHLDGADLIDEPLVDGWPRWRRWRRDCGSRARR